jgi:uncharacterized protein YjgD (DUF1641 family)
MNLQVKILGFPDIQEVLGEMKSALKSMGKPWVTS